MSQIKVILLASLLLLPLPALAQTQVPHTFTDGTPALASEVNENFDALADGVNARDVRIQTVEEELDSLTARLNLLEDTTYSISVSVIPSVVRVTYRGDRTVTFDYTIYNAEQCETFMQSGTNSDWAAYNPSASGGSVTLLLPPEVGLQEFGIRCTNPTNQAESTAAVSVEYAVGEQGPAGGLIVVTLPNGHAAMEVYMPALGPVQWGCSGTAVYEANSYLGLSGAADDTKSVGIVTACTDRPIAASIALDATLGQADDWHLPSFRQGWYVANFFTTLGSAKEIFWSAQEAVNTAPMETLAVALENNWNGTDLAGWKNTRKTESHYVRPVRLLGDWSECSKAYNDGGVDCENLDCSLGCD